MITGERKDSGLPEIIYRFWSNRTFKSGRRWELTKSLPGDSISSEEIDAVNGHLTATYADPLEILSWAAALNREPKNFPYVNSTKSMIGHCLGAAGSIETITSILELQGGFLHPSINCEDIHPKLEPFTDRIIREYMDYPELGTIAKASFGFGDVNSCLIIKKWENSMMPA